MDMAQLSLTVYTVIALAFSAVDLYYARMAFKKPEKVDKALGWSALFAGIVTLAYLLSVNTSSARLTHIASCLVFAGIDCMLVSLVYFTFLPRKTGATWCSTTSCACWRAWTY